jgi:2-polyprenyl-3-methyl-5-hydroxy-6-metoxy-1,4-benzoquinol methylase
MDSETFTGPSLEKVHRDLARIHGLLGSFPTIERFLRHSRFPVRSVLDVGCGGGDLLKYLRRRMGVEVIGVDLKPGDAAGVSIIAADATSELLPKADVAISLLLAHHLTPEQNIALIRNVGRSCKRFVILDLIRHPLPLTLFSIFLTPLIGKVAAADGKQSVRRAFTPEEFAAMVKEAVAGTGATFTIDVPMWLSRQVIDIRYGAE